jgi:hypothetical protein
LDHQATHSHARAVELIKQRQLKKDPDSISKEAFTEMIKPRRLTVAKIVRIIKSIVQHARPLHDYIRERRVAAQNGALDLCIETGALCDPTANCTSDSTVEDILKAAATVCRRKVDAEVREVTAVGICNDETTGADTNAHSQTWIKLPGGKKIFAGMARLEFNQKGCEELVARCKLEAPANEEFTMKGGVNTCFTFLRQTKSHYPSLTMKKLTSGSADGTASNTSGRIGMMAATNAERRLHPSSLFDMIWTICLPHCLSLAIKEAYMGTP